jgi:hypothetical protein
MPGSPYNHSGPGAACAGCKAGLPLTLADRERLHGRSFTAWDPAGRDPYCTECLASLPHGFEALSHVCGRPG